MLITFKLHGRKHVKSFNARCSNCGKIARVSSYFSLRFLSLFGMPLLPVKRVHVRESCPLCGHSEIERARAAKANDEALDAMIRRFEKETHCSVALNDALRAFMVYDERSWFDEFLQSNEARFANDANGQYFLAKGFCRFGEYETAMRHARTAVDLGADEGAEELLAFCRDALDRPERLEAMEVRPSSAFAAFLPLAALLSFLLVGAWAWSWTRLKQDTAWLVNGADRSYWFEFDGERHRLSPGETRLVPFAHGEHELRVGNGALKPFTYSPSLFAVLLGERAVVINPDKLAVFRLAASPEKAPLANALTREIAANEDPSLPPFTLEPRTSRLDLVHRLTDSRDFKTASAHARAALRFTPRRPEARALLEIGLRDFSRKDRLDFTRDTLDATPILMDWHLYHQNRENADGHGGGLAEEYAKRCSKRPRDGALLFLLARVTTEPLVAEKLYALAEESDEIRGEGHNATALSRFARGDAKGALEAANRATTSDPARADFERTRDLLRVANRSFARLADPDEPAGFQAAAARVLELTIAGYHQRAETLANSFSLDPAERSALHAIRFNAVGNTTAYLRHLEEANRPDALFQRHLFADELSAAKAELDARENVEWNEHLLLACAAYHVGDDALAKASLKKAADALASGPDWGVSISRALDARTAPALEETLALRPPLEWSALVHLALARRHPELAEEHERLVARDNVFAVHPHLLVKRWTR